MDKLFGDDEPKKPKKEKVPLTKQEIEMRQLRGNKGNKHKKTQMSLQSSMVSDAKSLVKCWSDDIKGEEEVTLDSYLQKMYSKDLPVVVAYTQQDDKGNIEYKVKLTDITVERFKQLTSQMKFRLNEISKERPHEVEGKYRLTEGTGQAFYRIGVEDNGTPLGLSLQYMLESLKNLHRIANQLKAQMTLISMAQGIKGKTALVMVQKAGVLGVQLEIKALLFGDSSHGKSTLLGVLKTGQKDDGKGKARMQVFTSHKQLVMGSTQSINHQVIAFDSTGKILNQLTFDSWQSIISKSTKILTMIDVGGHKKAEKQLISSLCSFFPEYAIVVLSSKHKQINKQPMHLATAFNIPMIIVITHIDMVSENDQREMIANVKEEIKKLLPDMAPTIIKDYNSAILASQLLATQKITVPIFPISNVTGQNLDVFIFFLNQLTPISYLVNYVKEPAEFLISQKFSVTDKKKTIIAGTVLKGRISKGQMLHLGPDNKGNFQQVEVVDVRCMKVKVDQVKCGQICTICITSHDQICFNDIRRGMVLVESKSMCKAIKEFQAEIRLLSNGPDVPIKNRYQPVLNTLTTRQICEIVSMAENEPVRESTKLQYKSKKSRSINSRTTITERELPRGSSEWKLSKHRQSATRIERKTSDVLVDYKQYELEGELPKIRKFESQNEQALVLGRRSTADEQRKIQEIPSPSRKEATGLERIPEEGHHRRKRQEVMVSYEHSQSLRLRFKYNPEYISIGQMLIINDALLKAVGKITDIYY